MYYLSLWYAQGLQEENGQNSGKTRETSPWAEGLHHLWGQSLEVAHYYSFTEGLGKTVANAGEDAPVKALNWEIVGQRHWEKHEWEKHEDCISEDSVRMGYSY